MKKTDEIRNKFMASVKSALVASGEVNEDEVLLVNSNAYAIPFVTDEGDEGYVKIVFSIPTGSREDKEGYDGYAEAQDYARKCAEKAEKAKKAAEQKAKNIKADAERRAKLKAEKEKEGK